jgi:hypothetical protein
MTTKFIAEYPDFLDGKATLKLITLQVDGPPSTAPAGIAWGVPGPSIDLLLVVPNERTGPAPVFLAMNMCGNQAVTSDRRVPLVRDWLPQFCSGCSNHLATESARGRDALQWPIAEMVRRGYALAAFCSADVDTDRSDVSTGVYAWLANGDPARNCPTNRGTLSAWAWGYSRCVDYLSREPSVDPKRIAVVGHSRNGKAALLAGAFDERISMIFTHQSGCGGSAPSRVKTDASAARAETVSVINSNFPHWFNARFKEFNDSPERLPVDQHCLLALCAPRAVLVSAAEADHLSNPEGQFQDVLAADAVYRFLGVEGLGYSAALPGHSADRPLPPTGQLIASRLGFYLRDGAHSMIASDWRVFMDYADRQWNQP